MRPHPLNPRPPSTPGAQPTAPQPLPAPALPAAPENDSPAVKAARAGGFHESSYELQSGLEVSESEWPDDVTIPGPLGER